MTKRAFWAAAGFLGLCLSLSAQQTDRPDTLSALDNNSVRFPSLALSDAESFSFAGAVAPSFLSTWMETASPDFPPPLTMARVTATSHKATAPAAPARDSSKEVVEAKRPLFDYADGEVGVLYGRSIGKGDRELEAGYIFGEAGNDKFQISAGAFYENLSGRVRRFGH